MKAIRILLIVLLIGSTLMPLIPSPLKAQTTITLKAMNAAAAHSDYEASVAVISARLKDFCGTAPECKLLEPEGRIDIKVKGNWNRELLVQLITRKGTMNIYETVDRDKISEWVPEGTAFAARMSGGANLPGSGAQSLCVQKKDIRAVEEEIQSLQMKEPVRWVWGIPADEGCCLYALQLVPDRSPVFQSNPVLEARALSDKKTGSNRIEILFHKAAASQWAEATRRNIDKCLAMVMDDAVVCAPMVRAEITGGRSAITGNFTIEELKFLDVLLSNGVLPMEWILWE